MEETTKKRKLREKLKDRYRLVILNEDTLEDVWYAVLSRMNFIVSIGFIGIILVAIGIILVSFTPLREYIPGYPDGNIRQLYLYNSWRVDSLEEQLNIRDQYILNIHAILKGDETEQHMTSIDSLPVIEEVTFESTDFDSILSEEFEQEERYGISTLYAPPKTEEFEINKLHFFCPLKGTITNLYDAKGNHYGIDIASNLNEPILSVLSGTVIMSGWTLEAGFIIQVQHSNDLISVYKHNSQLLKEMGDKVVAGEPIAIIGNTGEFTTGPHLHFELWHKGKPLNPNDYIVF